MPVDKVDYGRKELSSKDRQGQPVAQGIQEADMCPGLSTHESFDGVGGKRF